MTVESHLKCPNFAIPYHICADTGHSSDDNMIIDSDAFSPQSTAGFRVRIFSMILKRYRRAAINGYLGCTGCISVMGPVGRDYSRDRAFFGRTARRLGGWTRASTDVGWLRS